MEELASKNEEEENKKAKEKEEQKDKGKKETRKEEQVVRVICGCVVNNEYCIREHTSNCSLNITNASLSDQVLCP